MSELDVPPWQQPETVPATTEWPGESPFATGGGTAPLTEVPLGAELDAALETAAVAGEGEVPGYGQLPAGPEWGFEAADTASPGETGSTGELYHLERLIETDDPAEAEELFEAEEFARHAVYQTVTDEALRTEPPAAMELPARPAARLRVLPTSQLRNAWRAYECAEHRMVPLRLFGRWNTPVNPVTVDAWRALERVLTATGYETHRAWVYNCRDINGQHTRSLHAYGLAIDIDDSEPACNVNRATPDRREVRFSAASTKEKRCADVHAGIADTSFTPTQIAAVEAIRTVDGQQVFAWGGRWHTTKDTMHFQINVTPGELARGIQPGVQQQLAELPGAPGTVPYEALSGFDPEFDAPAWGGLERENQAAGRSDPFGNIAVSAGGFGTALRRFAKTSFIHDDVLSWLTQSPTYRDIVMTLDANYADGVTVSPTLSPPGDYNDDGVVTKEPHKGHRLIWIFSSGNGSYFKPYWRSAPPGDQIFIEPPLLTGHPTSGPNLTLETKGWYVERIAHESVHAARRVRGQRVPGKTADERIRAGIDDEIETRKTEGKIVDEIQKKSRAFAEYVPRTRSVEPWAVERDLFPGEQRRTYLEHFVLSELQSSAFSSEFAHRTEEGRDQRDALANKYEQIVAGISIGSPPYTSFLTLTPQVIHPRKGRMPIFHLRYPNILLAKRVIDARWRSVKDLEQRDVRQDNAIEKMRQEHAKAFFNNLVKYTKRP